MGSEGIVFVILVFMIFLKLIHALNLLL